MLTPAFPYCLPLVYGLGSRSMYSLTASKQGQSLCLTVALAVTVVLAAMYWRDHRRLAEQERAMKSLRQELDQLLGTRYMDLGSRIKKT